MNENDENKKPLDRQTLFVYFLMLIQVFLLAMMFLGKPIAKYKAKNTENILTGCLYYDKINSKGDKVGIIEGDKNVLKEILAIKKFPQYNKNVEIKEHNHCYKVKYITVNFNPFGNFKYSEVNLFKQHYVYDFIDE